MRKINTHLIFHLIFSFLIVFSFPFSLFKCFPFLDKFVSMSSWPKRLGRMGSPFFRPSLHSFCSLYQHQSVRISNEKKTIIVCKEAEEETTSANINLGGPNLISILCQNHVAIKTYYKRSTKTWLHAHIIVLLDTLSARGRCQHKG